MVHTVNGKGVGDVQLIIVINHRCNLKCRYCPTLRGLPCIDYESAAIAVDLFLGRRAQKYIIKFSGGEPLLDFVLLRDIMTCARNKARLLHRDIRFEITSNGTLLNQRVLDFLKENEDTELIISLDGDRYTQLRNRVSANKRLNSFDKIIHYRQSLLSFPLLTINMVIAPNVAGSFYENFLFVLGLGFKRFNFLPAYFVFWNKKSLKALKEGFRKIALFIKDNRNKMNIYVKNPDLLNPTPLFNDGLIVDCNGDIFASNLFLSRRFWHLRNRIRIGNIKNFSFSQPLAKPAVNIDSLIKENTPSRILESTQRADEILTGFVNLVRK
jgi:uncharacterized protein